jgi:hypothetical protein
MLQQRYQSLTIPETEALQILSLTHSVKQKSGAVADITVIFTDEITKITFWHYIRSILNQCIIVMREKLKSIKKSTLVIIALLVLNIFTFTVVSSNINQYYTTTETISTAADGNNYFKTGVSVLDWSYKLLRYFRK